MEFRWKRGQAVIALVCVMLLVVLAACGNGDDDDDDVTTSNSSSTVTVASSGAEGTSTVEDDAETETSASATATEEDDDAEPTSTSQSEATATEGDDDEPAATSTSATSDPTATESSEATTPDTDTGGVDEVPEFETLDPELLPNFSLTMNFDAINLSGTPQTTLMMQMEQSAVDNYHLVMETDGEELEFWTIGEQSWTSMGGETIESPTGPLFSPADILTTGELIPEGLNAREEGSEEVNGRQTTKWVVDGADYVEYMNEEAQLEGTSTVEMTDGTGEVTIWVDDELNIMIKAEGDVAWNNSDDTEGSLIYDYEIHDIGTTPDVVAPL